MGLPQLLIDALQDVESVEGLDLAETLQKETVESLREHLVKIRRQVQVLEASTERLREAGAVAFQIPKQELRDGTALQDLDRAIEFLRTEEEERRKWQPGLLDAVEKVKAGSFSYPIPPADKALLVTTFDRFIQALTASLENLRDVRWDLIALRAENEDPGDAPVFDNPQDLLGYLKTLPK
jgi:hypothetical protein